MKNVAIAQKLYSLLLRAYPARLRADFGAEMQQLFADQLHDARERHETGRFSIRTFWDWLRTVPAEHYSEYRRRATTDKPLTPLRHLLRWGMAFSPNPGVAILITAGVLASHWARKVERRSQT